jgi:hypothetical protein
VRQEQRIGKTDITSICLCWELNCNSAVTEPMVVTGLTTQGTNSDSAYFRVQNEEIKYMRTYHM